MYLCRSARYNMLLLVVLLFVSSLMAGCQRTTPTAVNAVETTPTITPTPAPTRTHAVLPPTNTPAPSAAEMVKTRAPSPTPTATINAPQTAAAKATADRSTVCKKLEDAWEIRLAPAGKWKPGWCSVTPLGGYFYEYLLNYPSEWTITTFGDIFPNMAFSTGQKGVELRIYQVYNYNAHFNYDGTLEDAPAKAAFCDSNDKCDLVIPLYEKISAKQSRSVSGREVLVVDSQDGKYNIRRYFFFVPFRYARPKSNRLFVVKLYTPEPVNDKNYTDLENKIEDMIFSIRHNF